VLHIDVREYKGIINMDNPGKLAAYGIQDEEKKGQNPISVGHC
jgi:hypothetical protein